MKKHITLLLTLTVFGAFFGEIVGQNVSFAPYPAPEATEIFAPGIISNNYFQRDFALSPDGKLLVYSHVISLGSRSVLVGRGIVDGDWSLPEVLTFSGVGAYDIEPAFSPDGKELYFASNRSGSRGFDIWVAEFKEDGSFGEAKKVGGSVNSEGDEYYPSIDQEGNLYFTSERAGGVGGEDIWYSQKVNGQFGEVYLVPGNMNTVLDEFNSFVLPSGDRILFSSFGQSDGKGGGDIYSSVKRNGEWTTPSNLGSSVNSGKLDYCPFVDGSRNYLFFTSDKSASSNSTDVESVFDILALAEYLSAPGSSNIYWKKY
ncbi:MAG: PD40 domain-containing protein [Ekhidna sp.]|nr:PD40 domain-containing protein [Ekhidna sp.]